VLGLHADGRLVVAELKRDESPETVTMQALTYAAMVSRFTVNRLAEVHARFLTAQGTPMTDGEALARIKEFAPEVSEETLRRPRVTLVAGSFPPQVTATAVWLNEMGVDLSLIQVQLYQTADVEDGKPRIVASVSKLYPVPAVEDFTITPAQAREREAQARIAGARNASAVTRIVEAGIVPDGTPFTFRPRRIAPEAEAMVLAWLRPATRTGPMAEREGTAGVGLRRAGLQTLAPGPPGDPGGCRRGPRRCRGHCVLGKS
jgi:hypothetical protein